MHADRSWKSFRPLVVAALLAPSCFAAPEGQRLPFILIFAALVLVSLLDSLAES